MNRPTLFAFVRTVACAAALILALAAPGRAQDAKSQGDMGGPGQMSPEEMQKMMALMMPGENHKKLDRMVGSWKTSAKMWMAPGEPTVSEGTAVFEWILGGRYLQSTQTGTFNGMPFEGRGLDGYDNGKKEYFSIWIDNMGTGIMHLTGQASGDGEGMTYSGTVFDPSTMKDSAVREEIRWEGKTRYVFTMYVTMPGPDGKPQEMKAMEITADKI